MQIDLMVVLPLHADRDVKPNWEELKQEVEAVLMRHLSGMTAGGVTTGTAKILLKDFNGGL